MSVDELGTIATLYLAVHTHGSFDQQRLHHGPQPRFCFYLSIDFVLCLFFMSEHIAQLLAEGSQGLKQEEGGSLN